MEVILHDPGRGYANPSPAVEEQKKQADLVYPTMQQRYKATRLAFFTFLITCADIDALFHRYATAMLPTLDDESALALAALLDRGRPSSRRPPRTHARWCISRERCR